MKSVTNLLKLLLVAVVVGNALAVYFLSQQVRGLKKPALQPTPLPQAPINRTDLSSYATKDYVDRIISNLPSSTPNPQTVTVIKETAETSVKQTTIIPISTSYSTQNLDWADVPNSDFYLDLVNDYSEEASAYWEAFIHEQHGNGKVFARLFDVTHSIAVVGSDLETNNASSKLETSAGALAIWRGKNLYRVQIKSEKGFPVFFNSGRLKIRY